VTTTADSVGRADPRADTPVVAAAAGPIRRISVIVPMRNEARHIDQFVEDLASQDFTGAVQVLVADGGSTDGSGERLVQAAADAGVTVTLIAGLQRWVSHGLNACIRRANGDLIVRMDCHSRYPPDYLRRCAVAAEETGAENVGGAVVAEGVTATERAVACAMDSAFGGIGWTRHGDAATRVEADTVTFGAFRRRAFERAGLFDESLARNQDDEFNLRLRRAGGRIVLDPAINVRYRPRGSFRGVFRQYFEYGRWKIPVMLKHRRATSIRSLAPPAFVVSVLVLGAAAPWFAAARWLLAAELLLYVVAAVAFGVAAVHRRREPWRMLPRVLGVFVTFHVAFGIGVVVGTASAAVGRLPAVAEGAA